MKKPLYILFLILTASAIKGQNQDWVSRNPLPQNDFYAVKFFNQNTGYVCGTKGAILKTVTGDNQWQNHSINTLRNLNGMYFFDVNQGFIVGDSGLIIRTTNGGTNWLRIVTGNSQALRIITFANPSTGFAAGDNGIIIKSINGGFNWAVINSNSRNLRCIFFYDSNTGFAAGDSGLFMKTTNAGMNWSSQTLGTMSLTGVFFTSPLNGFMSTATQYTSSLPLRTTDGGTAWFPISDFNFYSGNWYSVKFLNVNTGYMVGRNCFIMKTANGGASWTASNSYSLDPSLWLRDMSIVDSGMVYFCGTSGYVLKALGNNTPVNIGGTKVSLGSISFISENTGASVGGNQYLHTSNGGLNWAIQMVGFFSPEGHHSTFKSVNFFSPSSAYRIYSNYQPTMGTWDVMDHSTDGGATWTQSFSTGYPPSGISSMCEIQGTAYMTALGKIYKNSGSGWVIVYSPGVYFPGISFANQNTGIAVFNIPYNGFARTSNGGTSWSLVQVQNTKDMNDIQLLASGNGYIAGDSSLLEYTSNFGNSWSLIASNVNSDFLKMQFINDNTGWLLARYIVYPYIKKLYFTSNSGSNLIPIQSLGSFDVKGFSFINALTGYVCGDSGVVLKTTNGGLTFVEPITSKLPDRFSLDQNYPNPFNPVTKIKFDVPLDSRLRGNDNVTLKIHDVLGREIATLVNEFLSPGTYEVEWDGTNYPSGIYFYKLITTEYSETRKMVLVK